MSGSTTLLKPPAVPQPPPAPRRRGLLVALIAVATVLVLAIPVAYLVLRGPSPRLGGINPPATPASDGRISAIELRNATLDIPAWPTDNLTCRSGPLTFVGGKLSFPPPEVRAIIIPAATNGDVVPAYGDLDGDGAQETIALVSCFAEASGGQLLAFDRDADGKIVTMGTVVAMTGDIRDIDDSTVRVLDDGTIEVSVGDYQNCCGANASVIWQTRGYAWDGQAFHQISGPTSFPTNPTMTETSLTTGDLVLGPAVDGLRHGTMAVTITYLRGATPDHLMLTFSGVNNMRREGSNWPRVRGQLSYQFTIDLPPPPVGTSVTYTFAFGSPASDHTGQLELSLSARTAEDRGDDANVWLEVGVLREANRLNNRVRAAVLVTD